MYDNARFQKLVGQDKPTGEVVAVDRCLIRVVGLETVGTGAPVLFENGDEGIVRDATEDGATILNLSSENLRMGSLVVLGDEALALGVGDGMIGRVLSAMGKPIDGGGPILLTDKRPVFNSAPGVIDRIVLKDPLPTGVAMIDMLFPCCLGQRVAILGDSKSGKSTFLTQMTLNQLGSGRLVVYCLIAKRKVDVDTLMAELQESGAINHTVVVVAGVFDSLAQSYLAPYTACAIGEYFWYGGRDVVMVYDDLSSHAKVHRELSLLARTNPGRESYPGDMFFAHSSLLERAGKLASNGATMSAFPVVLTPNDDATAYLPSSIISITDGQIVFDLETFRRGVRPAVNVGLSVSRVGGRGQNARQKQITGVLFKKVAEYHQAREFARFGSEMGAEGLATLELGKTLYEALKQPPDQIYSLLEQELYLATVLKTAGSVDLDVDASKLQARELAKTVTPETDLDVLIDRIYQKNAGHNSAQDVDVTDAALDEQIAAEVTE